MIRITTTSTTIMIDDNIDADEGAANNNNNDYYYNNFCDAAMQITSADWCRLRVHSGQIRGLKLAQP